MLSKRAVREAYIAQREAMSPDEINQLSMQMNKTLADWLQSKRFAQLFAFLPHRGEPNLRPLLSNLAAYTIGLPVVASSGSSMDFHAWEPGTKLIANRFGILEPLVSKDAAPMAPDSKTLILVPAVAADRGGHRLGYGGGFYDRYLHRFPDAVTAVVVFSMFVVEKLAVEVHDRELRYLVTELEVGEVRSSPT